MAQKKKRKTRYGLWNDIPKMCCRLQTTGKERKLCSYGHIEILKMVHNIPCYRIQIKKLRYSMSYWKTFSYLYYIETLFMYIVILNSKIVINNTMQNSFTSFCNENLCIHVLLTRQNTYGWCQKTYVYWQLNAFLMFMKFVQ